MRILPLIATTSLLAACGGPKEDTGADTQPDTDSGSDSGDSGTDTDSGADSGDSGGTDTDSGDSGDTDTDTGDGPPLPSTGYYGPTLAVAVVADGPTPDDTARLVALDPLDPTTLLELEGDLRADTVIGCADLFVFALESRAADGAEDRAVAFDVGGGNRVEWLLGSNFRPTDVAVGGTGPWVASYGKARVSALRSDGTASPIVNLTDQADDDGIPEVMGLRAGDGVVYAVIARITQSTGAANGPRLLELDAGTGAVLRSADLPSAGSRLPSGRMNLRDGTVDVHYGATRGSGGSVSDDAALERVDVATMTSSGFLLSDSGSGRAQTAAWFDPRGETAWMAWTESGAPNAGAFRLSDGTPQQRWPTSESVVGLAALTGSVWMGVNAFDGSGGSIVYRNAGNGEELGRVDVGGRVTDFRVCERGAAPSAP
jgi:hypothetical protein